LLFEGFCVADQPGWVKEIPWCASCEPWPQLSVPKGGRCARAHTVGWRFLGGWDFPGLGFPCSLYWDRFV